MLLNQSATGRKSSSNGWGINLINSRTTNTGGTADSNGILLLIQVHQGF
jgi:hypothetical protein